MRWGGGPGGGARPRRREQRIEFRLDDEHLLPAPADLRQQLGARAADVLRRAAGVADLVEELLYPQFGSHVSAPESCWAPGPGHPAAADPACMHLVRVRRNPARVEVAQLLGQEPQAAVQPPL